MHQELLSILKNEDKIYEGILEKYLPIIAAAPSAYNPYHNFHHLTFVMMRCYEGALFHSYHETENPRAMRALLIAALFHDYGHTGVKGDDAPQIARAIEGLRANLLPEDKDLEEEIVELIKVTQFPHEDIPLSFAGQILRDADLSQVFSGDWIEHILLGLSKEWGISPKEMLAMQPSFIQSIRFYTGWAKATLLPSVPERLAQVQVLLEIL